MNTLEEAQQLVRVAQVLKVRARNLAFECRKKAGGKPSDPAAGKADWASRLAEDAESCLKQCHVAISDPDGAEEDAKGL